MILFSYEGTSAGLLLAGLLVAVKSSTAGASAAQFLQELPGSRPAAITRLPATAFRRSRKNHYELYHPGRNNNMTKTWDGDRNNNDDTSTARTTIDENGVPYDIEFLYGASNDSMTTAKEESTSTWPSKMMTLMVKKMGGSSRSILLGVSSTTGCDSKRDGLMRDGAGTDTPGRGNMIANKQRPALVIAYPLKIVAAIEVDDEQPSNRRHSAVLRRQDILDEIIVWPLWHKWVNLSTVTALLVILVTAGVILASWRHLDRKRNIATRSDYAALRERLGSLIDLAIIDKDDGPYHEALQWLAGDDYIYQDSNIEYPDDRDLLQRFSMAAIYFAMSDDAGAPWSRCGHSSHRCETPTARWLGPDRECHWAGVGCDDDDRVVAIDLKQYGLAGEFPQAVSFLWDLDTLVLQHGELRGSIPDLPIYKTLRVLDLRNNTFSGTIPSALAQSGSLEVIDISLNQITGTIVPSYFAASKRLRQLHLNENALQGPVHQLINDLPASLEYLNLYGNNLSGSIPSTLAKLSNLKYLSLDKLALTGTIPSEIRALTNLQDLALFEGLTTLQDFPAALFELSNLVFIDLQNCNLRGSLPNAGVAAWKNLRYLDVSNNDLTGELPSKALKDAKYLEVLDLSGNRFTGSVPSELCGVDIVVDCFAGEISCQCCEVCCDSGVCSRNGWRG